MAAPPRRGGLSLYDNLTDPNDPNSSSSATISSKPVLYNQNEPASAAEAAASKAANPALHFQPIRRPQVKQPAKAKPSFPKSIPKSTAPVTATAEAALPQTTGPAPPKSSLADWAATEEDEWMYGTGEKRQRGGRRKKKKRQEDFHVETDWDELYDPTRPTNIDEYMKSDEKVDEVREWKALLYRHRQKPEESDLSEDEEDSRPAPSSRCFLPRVCSSNIWTNIFLVDQFAPPPSYNAFAPPPKSPPAPPPDDRSGDDAYARRLVMSHDKAQPPPPPEDSLPPPPPPPPTNSATVSAAPVRYSQPIEHPPEDPDDDMPPALGSSEEAQDAPRSTRPGQAGFAARLMGKYGWTKGTGLGADESGIVNPLRVQVEKRRKKADADGGGWAEPSGKAKILGGKRKDDTGKFGRMSEVIVLQNMLEDMPDLQTEIADGLGQEIGEECGEKVSPANPSLPTRTFL